ncbi:solute carrier family 25 member 45 isoform X2 [Toxorhynchites rutilus septentrionalis]|uniref:solute carrier family 25 member 45 isoform X2 n=1 Tax=Toxorhynchites rutilus septentrionalis TaxID=329112 RepID=UPI00247A6661|nr:solute carrier family 25 member 45 isoform X2 [Toxorhynchites rutilus septentrionalis]
MSDVCRSCGILVGHPLDTIKTWQQFSNNKISTSMYNIIIRHNGLKGFYKGMFFPLVSSGTLNSIVFAVYGAQLRKLQSYCRNDKEREKRWQRHVMIAGSIAGAAQVTIGCPIEVVKVRLQTLQYVGHPWRCLGEIYHLEGIMGLYRGFTPMMWRDVVPYGIYMLVYEYMLEIEDRLHQMKRDRFSGTATAAGSQYKASVIATAGAMAGIVSWLFIVPFDVVKTIMQTETDPTVHKRMMDCFRSLVRRHGWRSLFRGSCMVIARAAPVNSATFLGYEWFLGQCHKNFVVDTS